MIFGYLMLVIAITISAIAAWYSVAGLTAIFSAAVIPVIIMGGALEAGKIAATVWLHNNWQRAGWAFKTYLVPAIIFLMLLTSMGIFGFLSKAHSDQSLVTGDAMSKIAIFDEKITTERDNIATNKKALEQMNAQVDQMLGRSDSENGAQRAVNIRKNQAKERASLQAEITRSQKTIQKLQEERAPLAAEFRKVEAEVGPIKYIAAFIYGDNPDQNVLERAVRWVIILIVVVFDPLALCLILAANKQLEWARAGVGGWIHEEEEKTVPTVAATEEPPAESPPLSESISTEEEFFNRAQYAAQAADIIDEQNRAEKANDAMSDIGKCPACDTPLVDVGGKVQYCPNKECKVIDPDELNQKVFQSFDDGLQQKFEQDQQELLAMVGNKDNQPDLNIPVLENEEMWSQRVIDENKNEEMASDVVELTTVESSLVDGELTDEQTKQIEETVEETKPIDEFNTPVRRGSDYAVRYQGKIYNLDAFSKLYPNMPIKADNEQTNSESNYGFGDKYPENPKKGDMFIRTDYFPDRLFKFNGNKWIEIDKNSTDSYTYNSAYIKHLIDKLQAGEYEIEDLSESERDQVERQIEDIVKNKNA
jgi:hypothetical protein